MPHTRKPTLLRVATILGKTTPGHPQAVAALVKLLETVPDRNSRKGRDTCWEALNSLEKLSPGHPQILATCITLLETDKSSSFNRNESRLLSKILLRNPKQTLEVLVTFLETTKNKYAWRKVANLLGFFLDEIAPVIDKIAPINFQVIATVIRCLENSDAQICKQAARLLGKIAPGNPQAIAALVKLLETTEDEVICLETANSLAKIALGTPQVITTLVKVLETTEDEDIRVWAAESLAKIAPGTPQIIPALIQVLENTEDEKLSLEATASLEKVAPGTSQVTTTLVKVLETTEDGDIRLEAAKSLRKVSTTQAITTFIHIIERKTEDELIRLAITEILGEMGQNADQLIFYFIKIFDKAEDEYIRLQNYHWLGQVEQWYIQIIAALVKVLKTIENESSRLKIAEILCEIGLSADLITDLNKIIENKKAESIYPQNAEFLEKVKQYHAEFITTLLTLLETTKGECIGLIFSDIRLEIANIIGKIEPGHPLIIAKLVKIIETTEDEHLRWGFVSALQKIITTKEQRQSIVIALKPILNHEIYKNNFDLFESCYFFLWKCSQNLTYPQFYAAWHHQLTSTNPQTPNNIPVGDTLLTKYIENQITPNFSQLQPTPQTYPLPINIQSLTDETDTSAICQEICTQIYYLALPDADIPAANNFAELKRHILTAKRQLQKRHLALILHECTPHPTLITCCRKIADANLGLHILWITDTPLNAPLRGFPPQQPNLLGAIQTWINELN
jgi:HEAT repeat protein